MARLAPHAIDDRPHYAARMSDGSTRTFPTYGEAADFIAKNSRRGRLRAALAILPKEERDALGEQLAALVREDEAAGAA